MGENKSIEVPNLNPLDFYPQYPHIINQIFEKLDNRSFANCIEVSKLWHEKIKNNRASWIRIALPKIPKNGDTFLHFAARTGQSDAFEKIVETEENKGDFFLERNKNDN